MIALCGLCKGEKKITNAENNPKDCPMCKGRGYQITVPLKKISLEEFRELYPLINET